VTCARFLVTGKVQGVFFRASTRNEALKLQLRGYARNLADGRVAARNHFDAAAVGSLEQWLWQGPSPARVDDVVRHEYGEDAPAGFVVS
jgi:acylphosphatase